MQIKSAFACFISAHSHQLTLNLVARTSLITVNTFQSHANFLILRRALQFFWRKMIRSFSAKFFPTLAALTAL